MPRGAPRKAFGIIPKPRPTIPMAIGAMRKAFGTTRKAFGATRKAFGTMRKAFGTTRKALGTMRKAFGIMRKAFGATRKAFGTIPQRPFCVLWRGPVRKQGWITRSAAGERTIAAGGRIAGDVADGTG